MTPVIHVFTDSIRDVIANGGKLGRKKGSVKTTEQKKKEYKEVISFLKRGYSVRNTATLANVSVSIVQRVKREFSLQKLLLLAKPGAITLFTKKEHHRIL